MTECLQSQRTKKGRRTGMSSGPLLSKQASACWLRLFTLCRCCMLSFPCLLAHACISFCMHRFVVICWHFNFLGSRGRLEVTSPYRQCFLTQRRMTGIPNIDAALVRTLTQQASSINEMGVEALRQIEGDLLSAEIGPSATCFLSRSHVPVRARNHSFGGSSVRSCNEACFVSIQKGTIPALLQGGASQLHFPAAGHANRGILIYFSFIHKRLVVTFLNREDAAWDVCVLYANRTSMWRTRTWEVTSLLEGCIAE